MTERAITGKAYDMQSAILTALVVLCVLVLAVFSEVLAFGRKLGRLSNALTTEGNAIMKTIADLTADVAAATTVEQSAVTLVKGLQTQLGQLKTDTTDDATAAAIDSLSSQLEAGTTALSAALTANTSAPTDAS